jgi:transposase
MPKRLTLLPHLTPEELALRYRRTDDPTERTHYQILWLLASGKTSEQVSEVTGYSLPWIRTLVKRYNQQGIAGVGDRRKENRGATPLLDLQQKKLLLEALQQPPPDGGAWNGAKVARWMSDLLNRPISPQRGWEYYKTLSSAQSPVVAIPASDGKWV